MSVSSAVVPLMIVCSLLQVELEKSVGHWLSSFLFPYFILEQRIYFGGSLRSRHTQLKEYVCATICRIAIAAENVKIVFNRRT